MCGGTADADVGNRARKGLMVSIRMFRTTAAVLLVTATVRVSAAADPQPVTFTDINDAVPGRFFDSSSSFPDLADPNVLVIGFNTGLDTKDWKNRDFRASLLPYFF